MWNALNDYWDNYRSHNNAVEILSVVNTPVKVACFCELKPSRREAALDRRLSFECLTQWSAVVVRHSDP